jgi:4-hydroxy-3-methylbut-2-enyl diphosphate reductase
MEILLSQPRGFCAGVIRAIEIVEQALDVHGSPVYVLHEIVHNPHVVESLRAKGAVFVENLDQIPQGAVGIFSAHGVGSSVEDEARERQLRVIDGTCPLVTKVHRQAQRYERLGFEIIVIGHQGHPEVEGTCGRLSQPFHVIATVQEAEALQVRDPRRVAYVTQTTLSMDDTRGVIETLQKRFPELPGPDLDDICYATQNRQNAVRRVLDQVDVLLVVGARNSSNSSRLREVGKQHGIPSFLIENAAGLDPDWFTPASRIGLTAAASAPELLVQQVVQRLQDLGMSNVTEMDGEIETTVFPLPGPARPLPAADTSQMPSA